MDVLRFINSNALREHLKEINYEFSGFEAAWLVWNCRTATLVERHAAWREIIETYPDEEYCFRPKDGVPKKIYLHSFLEMYMKLEQKREKTEGLVRCFLSMEFDLPFPFFTGDILYSPEGGMLNASTEPFVFYQRSKGLAINGYMQDENGMIERGDMDDFTSLEYYPEANLTGVNRALKALSSLVRGDIDEVSFANVFAYILADERTRQMDPRRYLTKYEVWLAGLEETDDDDDLPF